MINSKLLTELWIGVVGLTILGGINCADSPQVISSKSGTDRSAMETIQEYYEIRVFHIDSAEKQKVVSSYLEKALIPALNRMGIDRVGVFTLMEPEDDFSIFTLWVYGA